MARAFGIDISKYQASADGKTDGFFKSRQAVRSGELIAARAGVS